MRQRRTSTTARRRGDERAWRELLSGGLVVSAHVDGPGRRTIVAHRVARNSSPQVLTRMEIAVASRRSRGLALKVLKSELGCAHSTLSHCLVRARRKLRLRTDADMVGFFLSEEVRAALRNLAPDPSNEARVPRADANRVRLCYSTPRWAIPGRLSRAERGVVHQLIEGRRTRAIAHESGTSPRTVANQIASAFRKLGVRSRLELFATLLDEG